MKIAVAWLLLASGIAVSAESSQRISGTVWHNGLYATRVDFESDQLAPFTVAGPAGYVLSVIATPGGQRSIRLIDPGGRTVHSASLPAAASGKSTFRYVICRGKVDFKTPEPAGSPRCN